VLAIGNPFGLEATMTAGIVSAKGRRQIGPVAEHTYQDFIQTDAPINPGSSGGPLFDLAGNVVGINTAINAAGQGIGFAIPINMVKPLLPMLVENGKVTRSWLGVSIQKVNGPLAKAFKLPASKKGALVAEVVEGSPAQAAGIVAGDIILAFDGKPIDGIDDLSWLASTAGTGKTVGVKLWRKGKEKSVEVTLEELPADGKDSKPAAKKKPKEKKGKKGVGLTLQPIDPVTAARLGIGVVGGKYPGLIVTAIEMGSPLAGSGIERGDVVLEVDGKLVFEPAQVTGPIGKAKAGDVVLLYVKGPKQSTFVAYAP
jgi:serine protease Do